MIKVNKLIFFFRLQYFLKEIENMFSLFLSSYNRNTRESLAELEKAVRTAFSVLPNFHSCFYNSMETQYIFSFLIINNNSLYIYTFCIYYICPPTKLNTNKQFKYILYCLSNTYRHVAVVSF